MTEAAPSAKKLGQLKGPATTVKNTDKVKLTAFDAVAEMAQ